VKSIDTAPVRAGEELDLRSLAAYLVAQVPGIAAIESGSKIELEQFAGGHSNLTYLIRFGADQFVLRRHLLGRWRRRPTTCLVNFVCCTRFILTFLWRHVRSCCARILR